MADLEMVIQVARKAVILIPEDHFELADRLNNLGNSLGNRYERIGDIADLEEAIEVAQ